LENSILEAKEYFYNKEYKQALELFLKKDKFYEAGLCFLLCKDIKNARFCFEKEKKNLFAASWGLKILDYIKMEIKKYPSYLQVRAFYEIYLNLFIENDLIDYAQNLINIYPSLMRSNPEICKFIARALSATNYDELALNFTQRATQNSFFDPEAFFIASEIYVKKQEYSNALDEIKKILDIMPKYYPALKLKEQILEKINQ